MKSDRKKKRINMTGCPRCGGKYVARAGLMICEGCGHNSMDCMGDSALNPLHSSTSNAAGVQGVEGGYRKRATIYTGS